MEKDFLKKAKTQWRKKIWNDMNNYWSEIIDLKPDMLENNNIPIMFLLLDKYKTKLLNADVPTIDNWSVTPLNSISGKIRNHYNIEKHGNGGIITTSIVRTYSKFGNNLYITTITDSIYKLETPFDKNINLNLYFKESKF